MLRNRSTQSVLLGTVMVLVLAACATSPYRAADGRGFGYSERQLSDDQYRVHFKAMGDNTAQALDYAISRRLLFSMVSGNKDSGLVRSVISGWWTVRFRP